MNVYPRASVFEPQLALCPVKEEREFLLVSQRKSIRRINLADTDDTQVGILNYISKSSKITQI